MSKKANAEKRSVSLHPTDLNIIATIRASMGDKSAHLTFSECIKLALRKADITDVEELYAIWITIEDNRKGTE